MHILKGEIMRSMGRGNNYYLLNIAAPGTLPHPKKGPSVGHTPFTDPTYPPRMLAYDMIHTL